jgi:ribosomal-protein-alanine N-acetyltransferase
MAQPKPPEQFETKRLNLRLIRLDDSEEVFKQYAADPTAAHYVTFQPHKTIETVKEFITRCIDNREKGVRYTWAIVRREDNQLIGAIDLAIEESKASLGYILGRNHWNNRYMTEAVTALVDWAMTQPSIHRVWAVCDIENLASARVLEKVGMQKEGLLRRWLVHPNISPIPRDCWCYALVK